MGSCWRFSPLVAVAAIVMHLSIWSYEDTAPGPTTASGLLGTAGEVVAQFFAWMFLLLAISLVWSLVGALLAEFRLRRMYDRADRKWVRLPGYRSARGPHGVHPGPAHDTLAGHDPVTGPAAGPAFPEPPFLGAGGRFRRAPDPPPPVTGAATTGPDTPA